MPKKKVTVRQVFEDLVPNNHGRFQDKLSDVRAIVGVDISGPQGGQWTLHLQEGRVAVKKAINPTPDFTFFASDETADLLFNGKLDYKKALMQGKIRFKGDFLKAFGIVLRFFPIPSKG